MLATVGNFMAECRAVLLDEVPPYRYSESDMLRALNIAVLEARRLRPDLFLSGFSPLPEYTSPSQSFDIEPMYRPSFLYYVAGRMQLRDDEESQDARATALMNKFVSQLLTVAA